MLINLWQAKLHLSLSLSSSIPFKSARIDWKVYFESIAFVLWKEYLRSPLRSLPLSSNSSFSISLPTALWNSRIRSKLSQLNMLSWRTLNTSLRGTPDIFSAVSIKTLSARIMTKKRESFAVPPHFPLGCICVLMCGSSHIKHVTTSILSFCPIKYYWHKSQLQHSTNISNFLYTNLNGETAWWTKSKMVLTFLPFF